MKCSYRNLEKQLDKSKGIIEQLVQQIGELEKAKSDNERLLAGYKVKPSLWPPVLG